MLLNPALGVSDVEILSSPPHFQTPRVLSEHHLTGSSQCPETEGQRGALIHNHHWLGQKSVGGHVCLASFLSHDSHWLICLRSIHCHSPSLYSQAPLPTGFGVQPTEGSGRVMGDGRRWKVRVDLFLFPVSPVVSMAVPLLWL